MTIAAAVLATMALAGAPVAAVPPIAAYGQLPTVGDVALSPDGTRWVAVVGDAAGSEIQVREVISGNLLLKTPAKNYKPRAVQWADNDRIVLTVSRTTIATSEDFQFTRRGEYYNLLLHDLNTHSWKSLLNNIKLTANFVFDLPKVRTIDGRPQLVVEGLTTLDSAFDSTLFRIDPATGAATQIRRGGPSTQDWLIGLDGDPVARADYDRRTGIWHLLLNRGGLWKDVYAETAPIDAPYLSGLGRTPGTILVGSKKSGVYETYEITLADGSWSAALPDVDGFVRDPATLQPIGTVDEGLGSVNYSFWNADDQKIWRGVTRAFPGELVQLVDWSRDRNIVLFEVFGPKSGNALYVIDRKQRAAGLLSQRYAGIEPRDIAPVQTLSYKAADGLEIPAYLTLPPGRDAKNLPLIVFPHGGPESHDRAGFDWWAQVLASRGYAVLQPQYRGSSGFGAAHRDAGYGQWGRKMQTDVSDGVRHLAGLGTIDPKRVCIVGASYGGYAAMAGVTVEQGVYRCASAIAGVSDLRRMLAREAQDSGTAQDPSVRYWKRFMGASGTGDTSIDAWSPARLASRVSAPLQLIHGKDDLVVPFEQSNIIADAMKKAGKPVELVVLPSEDHWLSRAATRIAMLDALVAFLEKHNPPDPAP